MRVSSIVVVGAFTFLSTGCFPDPPKKELDDTSLADTADLGDSPDSMAPDTEAADTAEPPDTVKPADTSDATEPADTAVTADTWTPCPGGCAHLDGVCALGACVDGRCEATPTSGGSCDDGDPCTTGDTCTAGQCAGQVVTCAPSGDVCRPRSCDPSSGQCVLRDAEDGIACDDHDACTDDDMCESGTCRGDAVVCADSGDPCRPLVCSPTLGICTAIDGSNGAACDDGDACTQEDRCQSGHCVGSEPVVCTALDQCHAVGVCDPSTGVCTNPETAFDSRCDSGMEYPGFCRAGQCKPRMVAIGSGSETCLVVHGDLRCWNDPNKAAKDQQFYSFDKDVVEVGMSAWGDRCVRFEDTSGRCWGAGSEVSDTASATEALPMPVGSIAQVRVSLNYACVITLPDRKVRCWGYGPQIPTFPGVAEVTYGHMMDIPAVPLTKPVVSLAVGLGHACAVDSEQKVFCWGDGSYGQLGYGSTSSRGSLVSDFATPVPVGVLVSSVAAGVDWTCATTPSGAMRCWGGLLSHGNGRVYGDTEPASSGGNLQLGGTCVPFAMTETASYHACTLRTDGKTLCWGKDIMGSGVLGNESVSAIGDDERPNAQGTVDVGEQAVYVTAGGGFLSASCAIGVSGRLHCWGAAALLGYGDGSNRGGSPGSMPPGDVPFE